MIARRVLGAVGAAVDWSLIHLLAAISDRVEGRGADCYRRADALADMEAGREVWERGELDGRGSAASDAVRGVPVLCVEHLHGPHVDVRPVDPCECVCATCVSGGHCDTASCAQIPDDFEATEYLRWPEPYVPPLPEPAAHGFSGECPDAGSSCGCGRSAAVTIPAADNTPDCGCGSGTKCPDPITCPDAVTAAMDEDTAAADGTDLYDSIVALFDYHDITRNPTVDYLWRCDGCNWKGNQRRDHTLHRLALVADMKNATERIQEQLAESTNACVVDGCDFWWHTYEQLNSHSRQMHLEPNPLPAGGFRYPGADHVGDFTWHHVPTHRGSGLL